jgi:hypothetical protein
MDAPWETLILAGMPDGAVRRPPASVDLDAIRRALSTLDVAALTDGQRVVLLAWLDAFRQHWPSRYEAELEGFGGLRAALHRLPLDANRYIKLRRIAIENLASVL